jgi:hypothetical protein
MNRLFEEVLRESDLEDSCGEMNLTINVKSDFTLILIYVRV